jgi:hypothetical protein
MHMCLLDITQWSLCMSTSFSFRELRQHRLGTDIVRNITPLTALSQQTTCRAIALVSNHRMR